MGLLLIILGMAVVTFVPRLLPVFIIDRLTLPKWMHKWLRSIPYAALGALIFPGILSVEPSSPVIGVIGGGVAALIAYFRGHILLVILAAILTVFILQMWLI
ncbi:branched-chain amino acid transport [Caldalkalibacillus thermarum TA2.A1]|uniref:AzlD domain-containing protein n=1 Tax=Caldalkalibacillus thermarum (strain TA2.A1) TaxID=986075 RepID=F5L5N9_CALTT|nr:AzlD domain-containing protein [Caldalkalibacillus thermarum]EGL83356.1 branched-chain amino acid transport [Caldalkalibacillus thermarum TA2.A1]QZT34894.1 AzlD domain-containing protein [Caldalkalibacillus thermarum TA2.A1]